MPVLPHDPGVHRRRHVTQWRDLADFVEILVLRRSKRFGADGASVHGSLNRKHYGDAAGGELIHLLRRRLATEFTPLQEIARRQERIAAAQFWRSRRGQGPATMSDWPLVQTVLD